MKIILAYLLAVVLGFQVLSKTSILLQFNLNRDYISEVLCIKKDIKENSCNGSCHLKKLLEKDEQKEEKGATSQRNFIDLQFIIDSDISSFNSLGTQKRTYFLFDNIFVSDNDPKDFFQPPRYFS